MGFVVALLVSLAITIVGELLRPKQKPENAKASGLDDFSIPTATEGRQIPLWVGKVKIDGSNVTAYGDLQAVPLTKKVKTGLWSSERQTYAHKYFMGMQMALGWGDDSTEIHEVRFGDAMPAHTRTDEGNGCIRFDFDDEEFFGGNEKEGGISGTMRFYTGTQSQGANAYLAYLVGETVPAYKGLVHAVLEGMYIGTSVYIKTISYIVSRYPNTLGVAGGKHRIGDDANPACFIYEVITNPVYALGLQPTDVDQVAFRAAAETLHAEGYGMSIVYNGGSSAQDIISDVLRHVDGVVFSDVSTGLLTIRLARGGYDKESLPVLTESDFLAGIDFTRPSWSETKNVIRGTYVNRSADYTVEPVAQQDLGNLVQRNGEIALEEIDFTGFSSYAPCALAVARALKTLSYPLSKISGPLNGSWRKLRPADVFRLRWSNLGIDDVVFRVVRIRYGGLESNQIEIEAVEDIFSVEEVGYVTPPPPGWTNPLQPPAPPIRQDIAGLPFPLAPTEGEVIGTFATRSGGLDEGYGISSDRGEGYEPRGFAAAWTPSALTETAWPVTAAAEEAVGPQLGLVSMLAQVDNDILETSMRSGAGIARVVSAAGEEYVAYGKVDTHLRRVWRGILDTVPLDHPAGAVVWFVSSGRGQEGSEPYGGAVAVDVKLLPFNARGSLALVDAPEMTLVTDQRGSRPFPPGNVKVNGVHPLSAATVSGEFVLTWSHRSRLADVIVRQDDPDVTPEEGTQYRVRAYRTDTNALLAEGTGNTGTAICGFAYTGDVRIEMESIREGLTSRSHQSFVIAYDGSGVVASSIAVDVVETVVDGGEVEP